MVLWCVPGTTDIHEVSELLLKPVWKVVCPGDLARKWSRLAPGFLLHWHSGHSGCVSCQELWEQGVQQEQGSWHGKTCSCCPEVLLKTVQDCWSQQNDGSDIQQHGLLNERQSPVLIRGLMARFESQMKMLMCLCSRGLSVQPGLEVTLVSPVRREGNACEGEKTLWCQES